MNVSQKIKKFRLENGFSQQDIAIKLKMCDSTYRKLENGATSPDIKTLEKLSEFYQKSLLDFLPLNDKDIKSIKPSTDILSNENSDLLSKKLIEKIEKIEQEKLLLIEKILETQSKNDQRTCNLMEKFIDKLADLTDKKNDLSQD